MLSNYIGAGALIGAVVTEKQPLRRPCDRPRPRRRSHALGRSAGKRQRRGSTRRGRFRWRRGGVWASGRRRGGEARRGRGGRRPRRGGRARAPASPWWGRGVCVCRALGIDPSLLIGGAEVLTGPSRPQVQAPPTARRTGAPQDDMGRFVSKVLGSTELQWKQVFAKDGKIYRAPVLVLYRGATHASCGGAAQSAMGPFYCPADQKVYLDTSFFDQIATRFRGCDVGSTTCRFSQAYVIAHEVGHHVQN